MTKKEKQLLLKDLCARLQYGVKVLVQSHKGTFLGTLVTVTTKLSNTLGEAWIEEKDEALWCDYSLFKPYLRPMSSMTEEETKYKLSKFFKVINTNIEGIGYIPTLNSGSAIEYVNWLIENHFDYHGLIPMGLALEAPEGMYKNE